MTVFEIARAARFAQEDTDAELLASCRVTRTGILLHYAGAQFGWAEIQIPWGWSAGLDTRLTEYGEVRDFVSDWSGRVYPVRVINL